MKKLLFLFFSIPFLSLNAQDLTDWQIGVNINPFIFSRTNPEFLYQKDKQNYPNGFGFGITIEKNWNEKWGFKTGIERTKQNENYFFDVGERTDIKQDFEYYKVPITVQYTHTLNEKLYLTLNQGVQFSFLNYFKTMITGLYESRTFSSNYSERIFFQNPEKNEYLRKDFKEIFHKKNLYGIIGSVGLKGFLSDRFSYTTNVRYEFDINSADTTPLYTTTPGGRGPEGTTHNFRIGLEFGLQYHFKLDLTRFDKKQHKN